MNTVLGAVLGVEYAQSMIAVRYLRNEYAASIPKGISEGFRIIEEVLESITVLRQFYKTIAIQRNLATLSRLLGTERRALTAFRGPAGLPAVRVSRETQQSSDAYRGGSGIGDRLTSDRRSAVNRVTQPIASR
ncbi:hypothetical protein JCM31271_36200 [Halorubrum trueperi]